MEVLPFHMFSTMPFATSRGGKKEKKDIRKEDWGYNQGLVYISAKEKAKGLSIKGKEGGAKQDREGKKKEP